MTEAMMTLAMIFVLVMSLFGLACLLGRRLGEYDAGRNPKWIEGEDARPTEKFREPPGVCPLDGSSTPCRPASFFPGKG